MSPQFTTAALHRRVRAILDGGRAAVEREQTVLFEVLFRHPHLKQTPGAVIRLNNRGDGLCLVSAAGESVEFSYRKCRIDADLTKIHRQDVLRGMRNEVRDQTTRFRREQGFTHQSETHHVGHDHDSAAPFVAIATAFVEDRFGGVWTLIDVKTIPRSFGVLVALQMLVDRDVAADWQAFHAERAVLRMEAAADNCRAGPGAAWRSGRPPARPAVCAEISPARPAVGVK
jgi:hypothetical protein